MEGEKYMVHLINDIEIRSKNTREKHGIQVGKIKFDLSKEVSFIKKQLNYGSEEFINIRLDNEEIIILYNSIDKISYDNVKPYIIDFYTLLNNKFVGHCVLDNAYIEYDNDISYSKVTELHLKTGVNSQLIVKKLLI